MCVPVSLSLVTPGPFWLTLPPSLHLLLNLSISFSLSPFGFSLYLFVDHPLPPSLLFAPYSLALFLSFTCTSFLSPLCPHSETVALCIAPGQACLQEPSPEPAGAGTAGPLGGLSRCPDIRGRAVLTRAPFIRGSAPLHKQSLRPAWGQVREHHNLGCWLSSLLIRTSPLP